MANKLIIFLLAVFFQIFGFPKVVLAIDHSSTINYYVGDLGDRWQFPSDHLPIGLSVGNVHLASWNVLNSRYIYHIETNQQGLKESLIVTSNYPVANDHPLTIREALVIDQVLEMIHHPTHPRSLIALQEVSENFLEQLKEKLPGYMKCVTSSMEEILFIYNAALFEWVDFRTACFQVRPRNSFMTLTLLEKETGLLYHFIQAHIPAAPGISSAARREFAQDIITHFDPDAVTVIMGDMNRSPDYLLKDFKEISRDIGMKHQPLSNVWIPYPTHIDTKKHAAWIDSFFYYNPFDERFLKASTKPESLFADLSDPVKLLRNLRPSPLDVAFEIECKMKIHDAVVIYGAPGSGKTEQMGLAFKGEKLKVFDLREEFLNHYYLKHEVEDSAERKKIRKDYGLEEIYHQDEYQWLSDKNIQIANELISSEENIIVFDEFDLCRNVSPHKLSTFLTIATLANRVKSNGKKVALIVHEEALTSREFWDQLSKQIGLTDEDIVKTRFLIPEEEMELLDFTTLTDQEKTDYQKWAAGIPAAYLHLMEFAAKSTSSDEKFSVSFDQMIDYSTHAIEKIWNVILKTQSQELIDTLFKIAHEPISKEEETDELYQTGLVDRRNGHLLMPYLVQEVIKGNLISL